jgi:phosphate-selective porin OprO/OprP
VLLLVGGVVSAQQMPLAQSYPAPTVPVAQGQPVIGQPAPSPAPAAVAYRQEAGAEQLLDRKTVEKMIADALKAEGDKKKAADEKKKTDDQQKLQDEGYRIGSILNVNAAFNKDGYLWLKTPNEDFTMHIGYWVQYDNVWWTQSPLLRVAPDGRPGAKQGVASGVSMGGIGDLEDGMFFRRIRPFLEGTFWENGEYRLNLALENNQFSSAGLDEFWMGFRNVPLIGRINFGHVKNALGLEADMTASSRCMTFMERSSYSEAIGGNENFVTGVWFHNSYLDDRVTYTYTAFRQDNGVSSGAFFGDGQWGWQGRLTALPIYECEGRQLLHVGLSGGWRNGVNNVANSTFRTFQLRARPELRDDDPAGSPAGGQALPDADSNRMVDTGVIVANRQWLTGLELLYVAGPFSVQGEWGWNWIDHAFGFNPTGFTLAPALKTPQNYVFNGGYVQVAYSLTGENRLYDKALGTLDRTYLRPFSNAWLVRDEYGNLNWGIGAWELAARWSYISLNDGVGLNRIQGGVMNGFTAGLNWYINTNIKFQFDYVLDQRSAMPLGAFPGTTQGFGTRVQLSF